MCATCLKNPICLQCKTVSICLTCRLCMSNAVFTIFNHQIHNQISTTSTLFYLCSIFQCRLCSCRISDLLQHSDPGLFSLCDLIGQKTKSSDLIGQLHFKRMGVDDVSNEKPLARHLHFLGAHFHLQYY